MGTRLVWARVNPTLTQRFCLTIVADACADCDQYYDWKGCGAGLVCGHNNCAYYHTLGPSTGFNYASDCCERKLGAVVACAYTDRIYGVVVVVVMALVLLRFELQSHSVSCMMMSCTLFLTLFAKAARSSVKHQNEMPPPAKQHQGPGTPMNCHHRKNQNHHAACVW